MDKFYLYKALQIAKSRLGFTAPNPAVGALIVNDGGVLSCGWHDFCGADHAEVMAIKNLKTKFIDDAVLYVTLEPCSHYGKTPPCVLAIISAGIKKVVYGLQDPNMEVGGRAIAMLAKAGVECYQVDLEEINEFYQFYQYWCRTKQSWFSAKLAITKNRVFSGKDGPIAITKSAANYWTHRQRCSHDAMLVTMKTIQKDNPLLTVRYASKSLTKPLVVLVAGCDFSLDYRCFFVKRDVLFIFSVGGGNLVKKVSVNLIKAIDYAKIKKSKVLGIVGRDGGYTAKKGDAVIIIPTLNKKLITPYAESFQSVIWHCLVTHPKLQSKKMKW